MKIRNWIVAGLTCGLLAGVVGCEWSSGDTDEIVEIHKVEPRDSANPFFSDKLANYPVKAGTVYIRADNGLEFIDNGDGKLRTQTSASGTINYNNGTYDLAFGVQRIPRSLRITYKQQF